MGLDMDDRRAPYLQVSEALRAAIHNGDFAPGDRLPTVTELAEQYGVAKMTVQRAISELRDAGLVTSWQGRGTFVREQTDSPKSQATEAATYDAIIRRLDGIADDVQQLADRVAQLETQRTRQTAPKRKRAD
jgi:DNA-binding GntR family transcriptional regulator